MPFLRAEPSAAGLAAVERAVRETDLKARGAATQRCEQRLSALLDRPAAVLMVQSCTAALELSAMLLGVGPGDEVIMPSFGFASAANAFVLRGATPVFADIAPGTLNLDPAAVRAALTPQTRAILVVHYAGVAADMEALLRIAAEAGVPLVEDAAQGIGAAYRGRPLGTLGALGAISFDATKNLTAGSGGALIINDPVLAQDAETLRDYGTDRARFARGEVARYRWVLAGKNAAMNELAAAYLAPQLDDLQAITAGRRRTWDRYHAAFAGLERDGLAARPLVPAECASNAHIYALVLNSAAERTRVLAALREDGVEATFHYVPLHSAPAGEQFGRADGPLPQTTDLSARLLRLPLWNDMPDADVAHVIDAVEHRVREHATPGAP
ncbi:dTDP-4-amino-4,6-dideoxygalactose transaminase [Paraconexibacter sp. AEG42_29]|uniref:dTDP-4-amino-4,6-dideoxygalactose transaminase n=1 Tax=Paraconexibacter sp. AEG42_29 TaxID=2997339 RepID=UPI00339DA75B